MMRRVAILLLSLFCGFCLRAQQPADGAYAALDSLALNYLGAIQMESVETKQGECDYLIGAGFPAPSASGSHFVQVLQGCARDGG